MELVKNFPGVIILLTSISSCLIAQSIKIIVNCIKHKKLDLSILVKTGGMPSSHSAMVTSLASSIGFIDGFYSVTFALATAFALIVMYDASGVRRSVGIQARILNQMISEMTFDNPELQMKRIKEFIGHTPYEVVAGAFLGIVISYIIFHAAHLV
jgi:acid phosphatase family membrane protein YuiD